MARRLTFRKHQRLVKNPEFQAVLNRRQRVGRHWCVLYVAANGLPYSRLGVSVGRRWGRAVARNRVKRLVREAFRLEQSRWPAGYDWVVLLRSCPEDQRRSLDLERVRRTLGRLVRQAAQRGYCPPPAAGEEQGGE